MSRVFVLATSLSALLVLLVRTHALRRGLLDRPNARSSHSVATPRGGGLGLIVAFLIALVLATGAAIRPAVVSALFGVLVVAVIGWVDDHGGASVRARVVVHLIAGALLLPLGFALPVLGLPLWFGPVWWVFWTVASINVVNFMDGIDGIIGLQALVFGSYVALVGEPDGSTQAAGFALAGASLGFLLWNWSPAKIFMGDVGSGALGVTIVLLGALLMREGRRDLVAAFAPLVPLFLDASLTIIARMWRRERLSDAHRTHLYQRLANGGYGHARVALGFGACSLGCALVAARFPAGGVLLLGGLLAPCLLAWVAADRWMVGSETSVTKRR